MIYLSSVPSLLRRSLSDSKDGLFSCDLLSCNKFKFVLLRKTVPSLSRLLYLYRTSSVSRGLRLPWKTSRRRNGFDHFCQTFSIILEKIEGVKTWVDLGPFVRMDSYLSFPCPFVPGGFELHINLDHLLIVLSFLLPCAYGVTVKMLMDTPTNYLSQYVVEPELRSK